jgi:CheY-like chemotaxis protein
MTISCPSCDATLTIPDDRLPKDKVISASCPHCKGRVVIDTTRPAPEPASPPEPAPPSYGEGDRPAALVCDAIPAERESIAATLKQEGFRIQVARDATDAIERLRFTTYALVILREGFGSPKAEANPVLDHLAGMEMADRRGMLVVLVSPDLRSHDAATAFSRSVTLVLHVNDLPHLATALKRSRAEVDEAYLLFLESLRAAGKA